MAGWRRLRLAIPHDTFVSQAMTRDEALKQADDILEALLRSGNEKIFEACRGPDGRIDQTRLAKAAMRAREKIAAKILAEEM
jgi:hypothetical protein